LNKKTIDKSLLKEKKEFMVIPLRERDRKPKEPDFDDPIIRKFWDIQVRATNLANVIQGEDYSLVVGIIQLCQELIKSRTK